MLEKARVFGGRLFIAIRVFAKRARANSSRQIRQACHGQAGAEEAFCWFVEEGKFDNLSFHVSLKLLDGVGTLQMA